MARKNIINRAVEAAEPAAVEPMADGLVTVKANIWISEQVGGVSQTFAPGEQFKTTPDRADALGKQVTVLS